MCPSERSMLQKSWCANAVTMLLPVSCTYPEGQTQTKHTGALLLCHLGQIRTQRDTQPPHPGTRTPRDTLTEIPTSIHTHQLNDTLTQKLEQGHTDTHKQTPTLLHSHIPHKDTHTVPHTHTHINTRSHPVTHPHIRCPYKVRI